MENKIYCSFCINDRDFNKDHKIYKLLKEYDLETKILNSYHDIHSECAYYVVSDYVLEDDLILLELDKMIESDINYYGSL